jgi:hypothetical protein
MLPRLKKLAWFFPLLVLALVAVTVGRPAWPSRLKNVGPAIASLAEPFRRVGTVQTNLSRVFQPLVDLERRWQRSGISKKFTRVRFEVLDASLVLG